MSRTVKILLGALLALIILIGGGIGFIVSAKFSAERYEQSLTARDEGMQNVWGMMENNLKMQGFTVEKYGKDFINSIKANATRYANDKGSMMKWIKESQNQMSDKMHAKFMDTIEKAYAKKERSQANKISVAQEYRTFLKASIKGIVAGTVFNYPTENAKTIMNRIISTAGTKSTWESGTDTVADPFGN